LCQDGLPERTCSCQHALSGAIMTSGGAIPGDARERLGLIVGDRWPS